MALETLTIGQFYKPRSGINNGNDNDNANNNSNMGQANKKLSRFLFF